MQYSVLIVDREEITRKGTVELLRSNPDFRIVGESGDAEEVVETNSAVQPDAVLFRAYSLDEDGMATLAKLKAAMPSAGVIVLASSGEGEGVIKAIKSGAKGFLTTGMPTESLMSAIRSVARGEIAFSRVAMLHVIDYLSLPGEAPPPVYLRAKAQAKPTLTRREVEVLNLVAQGASNRHIAESLVISEHTVRAHLRNILDKLRLDNRIQAATWATRMGLGSDGVRAAQL
jgi:DNA-binding NarL/FixJ family response regulator